MPLNPSKHSQQVWLDNTSPSLVGGVEGSGMVSDGGRFAYPKKGPKVHQCPRCPFSSSNRSHFGDHFRSHTGEKPFACSQCSYRTGDKSNFKKHLRIHTGDKPFLCPYCPYRCVQKSSLKVHMYTHM
ncbi:protein krueppel-like [Penaeus japonicus]|uniref:protein krueppel-like n=1 Tax=Penaeus japonicus TaxID=27405 RepID=UPI001C713BE5|nr:protein krueppel-like [Penaeus japonicus]